MEFGTNRIIPFYKEKMEILCSYDERGHLLGYGKVIDLDGNLLCEGTFVAAPNEGVKSVSFLKSGHIYLDGQTFDVSNFNGDSGYGVIIRGYSGFGLLMMDVKAGHFVNEKLDGLGIEIDNVASVTKGVFKSGKFIEGIEITYEEGRIVNILARS